jgi:hypothetical protein
MSKPLRSIIGLLLLITTVSIATCQSMLNIIPSGKTSTLENNMSQPKSINQRPL